MDPSIKCVPVELKTDSAYKCGESFVHVSPVELPNISSAKLWKKRPTFLNAKYQQIAEDIANFEVRPDDIWVVTFPKCGTTWTQEMVRMLHIDLDYERAAQLRLEDWYVFFEGMSSIYDVFLPDVHERVGKLPSPRYLKSHLPIELLPKSIWTVKPKIIFTSRNPKDTAVSLFHHYRNLHGYTKDMDTFMNVFLGDETMYSPFYEHVLNFWYSRHEPNILFLTYEQMKLDMMAVLRKTQQFLGKSYSEEQLERLSRHLHEDTMRHNTSANNTLLVQHISKFIGIESDWKCVRLYSLI